MLDVEEDFGNRMVVDRLCLKRAWEILYQMGAYKNTVCFHLPVIDRYKGGDEAV